jgi:histidinol-phosphate aminotransferase
MAYERKNIQAMAAYVPGEQIDAPGILKLNTNENPYPPSPAVSKAMANCDVTRLRQYPPPTAQKLQDAIALRHGLESGNVIVTNGGDELLRMAIATFVETTETIAVARPTYTLYQVLAAAHGCGITTFELDNNYQLPENYGDLLNASNARVGFLVNPHAPSGTLTPIEKIAEVAAAYNGVLLLDEAYIDFVDPAVAYDSAQLVRDYDNVLILRTFSKGYSLAGLRMAYGLGCNDLIAPLMKTKDSYNTDLISQALAQAAIEDQGYARETWDKVRQERTRVIAELRKTGYIVPESHSNFVLATVPQGTAAESIYLALKKQGILVRYFRDEERLQDKLRITIGTVEDNNRLLAALN